MPYTPLRSATATPRKTVMAFIALLSLLLLAMAFTATPVLGNDGDVDASQNCETWSVTVTLNNNVSIDRWVDVISDIPGHPGLEDQHFDTTDEPGPTEIWSASGTGPMSGTVTLNIYYEDGVTLEDTDSETLGPVEDCEEEEEPGTITIVKDTAPDAAQDFAFTATGTGLSAFSLDDDADATLSNQRSFTGLAAGSYTVTETAQSGYGLTSLTCTEGGSGSTTTLTATITLAAGQTVTCTFVNTVQTSGTLPSTGGPAAAPRPTTGGNLPNTAVLREASGSTAPALGALLILLGLGLGGYRMAEARRRR